MPIEPVKLSTKGVLTQTTGEVSDKPYPCAIGIPVNLCHRSAVFFWTAIPPPIATRSLGSFTFKNSGRWINAWNRVLTPGNTLISGCLMRSLIRPVISLGLGTKINKPPLCIPNKAQAVKAKIWVIGNAQRKTSWSNLEFFRPGSSQTSIWMIFARIFLCSNIAPLETPVVPPVYCKKAMWSEEIWGLVKACSFPILKTSLNRPQGKSHGGTSFLIFREKKLIRCPLTPKRSPRLLTITWFKGAWSFICS